MATLEDVFRSLFPEFPVDGDPFGQPPRLPADVFAFSAHLLERSGASHHITPYVLMPDSGFRSLIVDAAMRNRATKLGREWLRAPTPTGRTLPAAPSGVIAKWRRLRKFRDEIVYEPLVEKSDAPDWWMPCLELMMIADEASKGIGFDPDHPFVLPMRSVYTLEEAEGSFDALQSASFSLSTAVDDLDLCATKIKNAYRRMHAEVSFASPRAAAAARRGSRPLGSTRFSSTKGKEAEKTGTLALALPVPDR